LVLAIAPDVGTLVTTVELQDGAAAVTVSEVGAAIAVGCRLIALLSNSNFGDTPKRDELETNGT